MIDHVYLFNAKVLVEKLRLRGVKIGIASSVARVYWEEAEIYPNQQYINFRLAEETRRRLALFGSEDLV